MSHTAKIGAGLAAGLMIVAVGASVYVSALRLPVALLVLAVATAAFLRTVRYGGPLARAGTVGKKWGAIALHYGSTVALVAVAVVLWLRLTSIFGPLPTFVTLYPAVLLAASIGGGGPGILATVLSALAADYWMLPPYGSFRIEAPNDILAMGIFTGCGLFLSVLGERVRRGQWAEAVSIAQRLELEDSSRLNEELSQQSEELLRQSEELTQQNEELQSQSEEIQSLNAELERREDILQKLLDAARLSIAEQTVMRTICAATLEIFGPVASAVTVCEKRAGRLALRAQVGLAPDDADVDSLPFENRFAEAIIGENKTACLPDASLRPDLTLNRPADGLPFQSVLSAPMRRGGEAFGAVTIYSRQPQEWTVEQFTLAEWLAAKCTQILETLRLQSQLRQQAEALRKAEQENRFLAELLEKSEQPFAVGHRDGTLGYTNRAYEQLVGYSKEELKSIDWSCKLTPPEWREVERSKLEELHRTGEAVRYEKEYLRNDCSRVPIELLVHLAKDEQTGSFYYYSFITDISERKRAEQEKMEMERRLLHAQKLESLGVLAGGIAHDFNNLLAGIMGYADLAMVRLPAVEPARADIEVIKQTVRRAADLTRQMLAYSGKGKFIVEPVNLSQVVEDTTKMLAMSVSKKATLTYNLAANLPAIQADAAQMCQVLMNLVINASEALGEQGGVIAVATDVRRCEAKDLAGIGFDRDLPEGLYVALEVADSGCGMDEQTAAKIFDPFFTTKFTGRGLGLAAVHGIVRGHKGVIQVSSAPGKGTTFRVLFPAGSTAPPAVRSEPVVAASRNSGTVLVVDDEELVRTLAGKMLEHAGFSVLTASAGREAVELFRQHQHEVRCVLLDLIMPDMDGGEIFRALHGIRPDVRVILSSGYSEEAATERFAAQGLSGFIQKPYHLDALLARIQQALAGAGAPGSQPA